jgi:hypothetical protein
MRERGGGDDYDSSDSVSHLCLQACFSPTDIRRIRPIPARRSKTTSLKRVSRTTKTRRRKRRKRDQYRHLDQPNVHPDHNLVDRHSDKPHHQVEAAEVEVGNVQIFHSMGKRELPLLDLERPFSLTELRDHEVLRPKLGREAIRHRIALHRLNQRMVEACHLPRETQVQLEHYLHLVDVNLARMPQMPNISLNTIDLQVDPAQVKNGKQPPHPLNQVKVKPEVPTIHQNANPRLPLRTVLQNLDPRKRNHPLQTSLHSRIKSCSKKSLNGSKLRLHLR